IELRHPAEFLPPLVLIEIDLERALQQTPRMDVCAIAFVAHANVFEAMLADRDVGVNIIELQSCGGQPAIASTLRAYERTLTWPPRIPRFLETKRQSNPHPMAA